MEVLGFSIFLSDAEEIPVASSNSEAKHSVALGSSFEGTKYVIFSANLSFPRCFSSKALSNWRNLRFLRIHRYK